MKNQNDTDEKTISSNGTLDDSLRSIANQGVILGLKESLSALNHFLDRKVEMGHPEYISRKELKTFLETYIQESKENFR